MDYSFIIIMGCAIFALSNAIPVYGAWKLAQKLASEIFLRTGLTIFFWLAVTGGAFALTGALKILSLHSALLTAAAGGILLLLAAKYLPENPRKDKTLLMPNPSYCDRVFGIVFSMLSALLLYKASYIIGTDTLLYHLYYPAMWITHGKIFAISLQGLPHEYFPVCGEVMYGWLMLTGAETPFYMLLQLSALLMALTTLGGLWRQYKLPELYIKSNMLLLVCTGIVLDNSCLGYTDSLTGSLLLTGTAFFLLSQHELESAPRGRNLIFAVLAGIALGMCSAVKYSGLILAPLITLMLPLLFTQKIFRSTGLKKCFLRYSLTAGAAIITAGAFYLPNFIKTGNPFYPVKIPFIFGNGIDFERPPVAFKQLWRFFINDSQWSMNTAMALLYTALYLATALLLVFKFNKKCRQNHLIGMCMILGLIFLIAEIVMLAIYPAMAQARSIIPFLMVSALLFAPVLAVVLPEPPVFKIKY